MKEYYIKRTNTCDIVLKNNKGYPWFHSPNVSVKGYAWLGEKLLHGKDLLCFLEKAKVKAELLDSIKTIDGFFSVIVDIKEGIFFSVDHVRSFPLFFFKQKDRFVISDVVDNETIKSNNIDSDSYAQLCSSLFVIGTYTLFENVKQLQSGNYAFINEKGKIIISEYWKYGYAEKQINKSYTARKLLEYGFNKTFERLQIFLQNRTAVIPLSGGHDSRLIAFYLKKINYPKLICYTYGKKGNIESKIAGEVAQSLNIKHYFIEYDRINCRRLFKNEFESFSSFSSNGVSIPCIQEWFAIKWLLDNDIIDENCVLIPGYSGDFLAGNHLKESQVYKEDVDFNETIDDIITKYCNEIKLSKNRLAQVREIVIARCFSHLNSKRFLSSKENAELSERFNLQERQAKFIQNALRTYEYYNLKWVTPFFEKDQFLIWGKISNELRYRRKVFFALEKALYPEELKKIGFAQDEIKKKSYYSKQNFIIKKFNSICNPFVHHYLMVHTSLKTYYYSLFRYKKININLIVKIEYLKILEFLKKIHKLCL